MASKLLIDKFLKQNRKQIRRQHNNRWLLANKDMGWVVLEADGPRIVLFLYSGPDEQKALEVLVNGNRN